MKDEEKKVHDKVFDGIIDDRCFDNIICSKGIVMKIYLHLNLFFSCYNPCLSGKPKNTTRIISKSSRLFLDNKPLIRNDIFRLKRFQDIQMTVNSVNDTNALNHCLNM